MRLVDRSTTEENDLRRMLTNKLKASETVFESRSAFPACDAADHAICNFCVPETRGIKTPFACAETSGADTGFPVFLELAGAFTILQT